MLELRSWVWSKIGKMVLWFLEDCATLCNSSRIQIELSRRSVRSRIGLILEDPGRHLGCLKRRFRVVIWAENSRTAPLEVMQIWAWAWHRCDPFDPIFICIVDQFFNDGATADIDWEFEQ